jgi:hypothetical protein
MTVPCVKCSNPTQAILCESCMEKEQLVLRAFAGAQNMASDKKEQVDHPKHYNTGKYEVIDVIEDWQVDFHIGNVIKYVSRAGRKTDDTEIQDLKKALWYLKRKIELLEKKDV